MHTLLVYAHPEPQSFTHALLEQAKRTLAETGHSFEVSDLYGEAFNPVAGRHDFMTVADSESFAYQKEQALAAQCQGFAADIEREQQRVGRAELTIFFFPLWWGAPPAILKGWFDRVMAFGFAYVDGTRFETGLFKGKRAMACVVTGGTAKRFSEGGTYGAMSQVLWPFQHCALEYLGQECLDPFVAYAAPRIEEAARHRYLAEWNQRLRSVLQNAPPTPS